MKAISIFVLMATVLTIAPLSVSPTELSLQGLPSDSNVDGTDSVPTNWGGDSNGDGKGDDSNDSQGDDGIPSDDNPDGFGSHGGKGGDNDDSQGDDDIPSDGKPGGGQPHGGHRHHGRHHDGSRHGCRHHRGGRHHGGSGRGDISGGDGNIPKGGADGMDGHQQFGFDDLNKPSRSLRGNINSANNNAVLDTDSNNQGN